MPQADKNVIEIFVKKQLIKRKKANGTLRMVGSNPRHLFVIARVRNLESLGQGQTLMIITPQY